MSGFRYAQQLTAVACSLYSRSSMAVFVSCLLCYPVSSCKTTDKFSSLYLLLALLLVSCKIMSLFVSRYRRTSIIQTSGVSKKVWMIKCPDNRNINIYVKSEKNSALIELKTDNGKIQILEVRIIEVQIVEV